MKAIFLCNDKKMPLKVYADVLTQMREKFGIDETVYSKDDVLNNDFREVEFIFSTWGMPAFTAEEIEKNFPALKAVFYGAGTVQGFARPFLERGVKVFSAWQANAVPVIEYAVAQITLANKGYFAMSAGCKSDYRQSRKLLQYYPGNYVGAKVGILGDGAIGKEVISRLVAMNLDVYVFSITMTAEYAEKIGVKLATLDEIFSQCSVISNHLANNSATKGIIGRELIEKLQPYSTFINTGRGAQVDENALAEKLRKDPTIFAILDVTDPEPPLSSSPFMTLGNVILTPHIAGSNGLEIKRMGSYMFGEAQAFAAGNPTAYEVTMKMLETMA